MTLRKHRSRVLGSWDCVHGSRREKLDRMGGLSNCVFILQMITCFPHTFWGYQRFTGNMKGSHCCLTAWDQVAPRSPAPIPQDTSLCFWQLRWSLSPLFQPLPFVLSLTPLPRTHPFAPRMLWIRSILPSFLCEGSQIGAFDFILSSPYSSHLCRYCLPKSDGSSLECKDCVWPFLCVPHIN